MLHACVRRFNATGIVGNFLELNMTCVARMHLTVEIHLISAYYFVAGLSTLAQGVLLYACVMSGLL